MTRLLLIALACSLSLAARAADNDRAKQQKQIRSMAQDTLQRLYQAEPRTKAAISHAYGYAVFSDLGVKTLFGGTGNGKGLAVNRRTKHETFMKMIEVQAGLGMGVDKFRDVFVFDN
jgi:lipid-binding SYLF domain-containing protein